MMMVDGDDGDDDDDDDDDGDVCWKLSLHSTGYHIQNLIFKNVFKISKKTVFPNKKF